MFELASKVAIVTGGTSGIGLGLAKGFVGAGARVALIGRDEARGKKALEALSAADAAVYIKADISVGEQCQHMVEEVEKHFGHVDILINNAGMNIRHHAQDYSHPEWHQIIDTNLSSAFYCSQAVYPAFVRAKGGKIIHIGSMLSCLAPPMEQAMRPARAVSSSWVAHWQWNGRRRTSRSTRCCRGGSKPS